MLNLYLSLGDGRVCDLRVLLAWLPRLPLGDPLRPHHTHNEPRDWLSADVRNGGISVFQNQWFLSQPIPIVHGLQVFSSVPVLGHA